MRKIKLIIGLVFMIFLGGCLKYSKERTYFTNTSDNRETHGVRVYRYLGFSK